jgi:hypothetical protein
MKCTIVSFYSGEIDETKSGIMPSEYKLAPCKDLKTPSILVVSNASHYVDVGEGRPKLRSWIPADQIAESVVMDWVRSKQSVSVGVKQPAVFWVEGEHTVKSILENFASLVEEVLELQRAWYVDLVKEADEEWAKKPGAHRLITRDAKLAVSALGISGKPWNVDATTMPKMAQCPLCYTFIDARATFCAHCRNAVDPSKHQHVIDNAKATADSLGLPPSKLKVQEFGEKMSLEKK